MTIVFARERRWSNAKLIKLEWECWEQKPLVESNNLSSKTFAGLPQTFPTWEIIHFCWLFRTNDGPWGLNIQKDTQNRWHSNKVHQWEAILVFLPTVWLFEGKEKDKGQTWRKKNQSRHLGENDGKRQKMWEISTKLTANDGNFRENESKWREFWLE